VEKQAREKKEKLKKGIDYSDPRMRKEILERQRRDMWTPEQVASFAKHFKLKPGMKLLDAGCGYGYSLRTYGPFCMPGGKLVGVDLEEKHLKNTRRLAISEGLKNVSVFQVADVYDLPFDKNSFDISIAQVVLCHLEKPEEALDELIRVTRHGSCIAIFDNSISRGGYNYWDSIFRPTIKQRLFDYEMTLRMGIGKKKQKQGDWAVGCYMPGWMEQRGLKNVGVRQNERVHWIAPNYKSRDQKTELKNARERYADLDDYLSFLDHVIQRLRVGGADKGMIRRYTRTFKRRIKRFKQALDKGTIAYNWSGPFWCIWGFKP